MELFGNLEGQFQFLEGILKEINPKGFYTVLELGLGNIHFEKVIETIKMKVLI